MEEKETNFNDLFDDDFIDDFEPNYRELNKHNYKVGDVYKHMTSDAYEYLENGNDIDKCPFDKYLEFIVEYITPENGIILKSKSKVADPSFDFSTFKGRSIKNYYPDFTGNDDEYYYVLYYEGNPFWE